jgi:hypothetical protein
MDLEFSSKFQEVDSKEILLILSKVEAGLNDSKVETYTKVLMKKVNFMVSVSIIGKMEVIIRVNSKKELGVATEFGRRIQVKVTNTKGNFVIIKKKDMEFIHGDVDIYTKGIIRII